MVTKDLDLCFVLTPENVARLRTVLEPLHPKLRITPKKLSFLDYPTDITQLKKNLYLETDLGIVDIMGNITGVGDYQRVADKAILIDLYQQPCKVISIGDLIASKTALGRDKDFAVVKELRVIREKLTKLS
jgi:hypothetical protein